MQLTRMFSGPSSAASDLLVVMTAPLEPLYQVRPGRGRSPAVEAIVMNASGCGVTVKDYGHIFRNDPVYAEKAARISELTKDLCVLPVSGTPIPSQWHLVYPKARQISPIATVFSSHLMHHQALMKDTTRPTPNIGTSASESSARSLYRL